MRPVALALGCKEALPKLVCGSVKPWPWWWAKPQSSVADVEVEAEHDCLRETTGRCRPRRVIQEHKNPPTGRFFLLKCVSYHARLTGMYRCPIDAPQSTSFFRCPVGFTRTYYSSWMHMPPLSFIVAVQVPLARPHPMASFRPRMIVKLCDPLVKSCQHTVDEAQEGDQVLPYPTLSHQLAI